MIRFLVILGFGITITVGFYFIQFKMFVGVGTVIYSILIFLSLIKIYFWRRVRKVYQWYEIYDLTCDPDLITRGDMGK